MTDRVAQIQAEWRRERPDLDTSPQGLVGRLHRLASHLTEEIVAVYARHGLSEGEFDVLAALRRAGAPYERAAGDLASHTMVTTGAITKRVDRLVAAGLVERRRADDDGRGRRIALTPAGLALIDEAFAEHMANEQRLVTVLSPADRELLEPLLTRWLAAFEAPVSPSRPRTSAPTPG
ncbi:MarR family winged helix-turn-helix transcriptional regulator [Cellulomonas sp. PhB150]|uniref:MarR family winged helix-turn-helix transcriptional regulator n=1 Tax=Cellulomonas sp. PhB150 TaxID=2485188 RepID=UPI000F46BAB3|nr:MarR family transcriptional regulator [Cellulomonas sp. PhB150]ROS21832.1 DNA-binding MarR family transcriptional regulator [Cellulomonas sp. PhB150]